MKPTLWSDNFKKTAVAIGSPLVAAACQSLLWSVISPHEYLFFFSAVMISALLGGFVFGVLSIIVSIVADLILFLPRPEFKIVSLRSEVATLGFFILTTLFISYLCDRLRVTKSRSRMAWEAIQRFNVIADVIPHMIWTATPEGEAEYINKALADYIGATPEQAYGWKWLDYVHPDDRDRTQDEWRRALRGGTEYSATYRIRSHSDGSYRWFVARGMPIRDRRGKIIKWYGSHADIDEQIKGKEELETVIRERDKTLAIVDALFSAVPVGMAVFDRQFKYIRLNEALARLNGVSVADTLGKTPQELIPEIGTAVEPLFKEVLESGKAFENLEVRGQTRAKFTGDRTWIINLFPIIGGNEHRKIIGIGASAVDISERKKMEKRLEDAIKMRDEFVSVASHELKTPLTSINLHAMLLQRECGKLENEGCSRQQVNSFVSMTLSQVQRIVRLVDDMLDVARIRTGNLTLNKTEFDFGDMIKETVYRHTPDLKTAGYGFPSIELSGQATGRWDRIRMEQVMTNLLNNAIKYGAGRPIQIRVEADHEKIHFCIQDQGPGIPDDCLDKIFDRFERGESTKKIAGLGLGLYITKQIVESHGGRIWVESELNRGSSFHVELPRYFDEKETEQSKTPKAA